MNSDEQKEVVMDKVSIIIPVYNVQRYLPECLDSIRKQSLENWEAILVDDGSTDSSGSICDEYARLDSRFVVVHQSNSGAACAKNTGLDKVTGNYVAFVDSDDYVDPDWLQIVVSTAVNYHADVVEFDFDKVYRTEKERVNSFAEFAEFTAESYLDQYVRIWTSSLFWNKLFRSDIVRNVRFKNERRCIDDEFFTYKVLTSAGRIVRISDVLYHYRQRATSAVYSSKNQHQIAADSLDVLVERYEWICKHFPKLRRTYLEHDVQVLFYFAAFSHTQETVKKFRKISQYYLRQVLAHPVRLSLLRTAVKLQFISTQELRREFQPTADRKEVGAYFQ